MKLISLCAVISAFFLALNGMPGWGWFLLVAVLAA